MSELLEIKIRFEELQNKYQAYLPKVDPNLIHDLLTRQQENPQVTPIVHVRGIYEARDRFPWSKKLHI